ncbi:MAG: helix-turn-helix domain-containing protein [Cyanobacteria bacterium P01_G01_bin.38]
MTDCVLETWQFTTTGSCSAIVIPDGCRDIIMSVSPDGSRAWKITNLDTQMRKVYLDQGVRLVGMRLRPGTQIAESQLIRSMSGLMTAGEQDVQAVEGWLNDCCHLSGAIAESLECLRSRPKSVTQAAKWLGVTPRTLQRLLISQTGRTPSFWLQLARARQAARSLQGSVPHADIAALHGYADQAHMSRDIKRWFGLSPRGLTRDTEQFERLADSGYD